MTITKFKLIFSTLALASMCGLTAAADDSDKSKNRQRAQQVSQSERDSSDSQSERQKQSSQNQQQSQNQQSQENRPADRSSQTGRQPQVEPLGWITVASDYNHDGFYDAVETIYYYDLKEARDKSRQRSQAGQHATRSDQRTPQKVSIQGTIAKLETEKSSDSSGARLIAKVQNPQGRTASVCLGPKSEMSQLNLSEGDRVSAEGLLTRKDGKQVLLATKVSANGKTVQQKLSQRQGIKQMTGTLKSLREAQSKRGDGTYLVGEIKTDSGTQKVHLGRKDRLSKLKLSEGDDIKLLTTTGKVSGKQAMLAVQVTANNQTAKLLRSASQQNSQSQRNEGRDQSRNADNDRSDG